jgi:16S rRNA (cytosine967-C5)-methyltransferase
MLRLAETNPAIAPLFDGSPYGPAPIAAGEQPAKGGIAPAWLVEALAASDIAGAEAEALLTRAPLDVRVNTLKAARDSLVLPEQGELLPAPHGIRFPHGTQVEQWDAYRDGRIEVQDCGSQLACLAAGVQPGETVIDLCAGAGGKTLALAAAMENKGRLVAADTDRGRLSQLGPRAERAGAAIAETILLNPGKELEALGKYRNSVGHRHLAPQPRGALAADAPGAGPLHRNAGPPARHCRHACRAGRQDRLRYLFTARFRGG